MNRGSFFIENKALFGSFPDRNSIKELENNGVKYFIDLTCRFEKGIERYNDLLSSNSVYIQYEIIDHSIPKNWKTFSKLIISLSNIIKELNDNELIYLHCKGGHGRSGIVASCVLCYFLQIEPIDAIRMITVSHRNRVEMSDKRRKIGFPQQKYQENFIYNFFSNFYINTLFAKKSISINTIGVFDINYILNQIINSDVNNKKELLHTIIKSIMKQHREIEYIVTHSGFQSIKYTNKEVEDILTDIRYINIIR